MTHSLQGHTPKVPAVVARVLGVVLICLATTIALPSDGAVLPVAPGSCGPTIYKAAGLPWVCTMAEDFDGTELDRGVWSPMLTYESGYVNGTECYVDHPSNISVSGSQLHLTMHTEVEGTNCVTPVSSLPVNRTGGGVHTRSKFSQAYGRFEIRARMPYATAKGVHSALWLYPQENQPLGNRFNGEIDLAEFFSVKGPIVIPNIHYRGDNWDANHTRDDCLVGAPWEWHTYTAIWNTKTITIEYDGVPCIVDNWKPIVGTKPQPFNTPFFINLTQTAGILDNAYTVGVSPESATMDIDYVRVWK